MSKLDTITHFINGAKVDTLSGRYADVYNPALGEPVARRALGTVAEVDAAVQAAPAAFPALSATPRGRTRCCSSTCNCASSTPTNSPPC